MSEVKVTITPAPVVKKTVPVELTAPNGDRWRFVDGRLERMVGGTGAWIRSAHNARLDGTFSGLTFSSIADHPYLAQLIANPTVELTEPSGEDTVTITMPKSAAEVIGKLLGDADNYDAPGSGKIYAVCRNAGLDPNYNSKE